MSQLHFVGNDDISLFRGDLAKFASEEGRIALCTVWSGYFKRVAVVEDTWSDDHNGVSRRFVGRLAVAGCVDGEDSNGYSRYSDEIEANIACVASGALCACGTCVRCKLGLDRVLQYGDVGVQGCAGKKDTFESVGFGIGDNLRLCDKCGLQSGCFVVSGETENEKPVAVVSAGCESSGVELGADNREWRAINADNAARKDMRTEFLSENSKLLDAPVRGPNYVRNKNAREARKAKKEKRKAMGQDWRGRSASVVSNAGKGKFEDQGNLDVDLRGSLEAKWKVQNELATERARRELQVLRMNDVENEAKRYRTKVSAATERNMVSIEKTHAILSATGNVPEVFHGSAETIVSSQSSGLPSLGSGSISPNSSVSEAEVRAMQLEILKLNEALDKIKSQTGIDGKYIDLYGKRVWTDCSENDRILDEMYPDGYGIDRECAGDGKFMIS